MSRNHWTVIAAVVFAITLSACRPKQQPTRTPQPNPAEPEMSSVDNRVSDLQRYSVELTALAKNLPGRDQNEDRQLLGDAFDRAQSALALLMGPEPHGAFRQQLRILDNVRGDIRAGKASDATVDSGMRALYNALVGIRQRLFATDDQIRAQLDTLRQRVDDLDSVRGPLHAVAVAGVYQEAAQVVETMTAKLEGRADDSTSGAPAAPAATQEKP